jgi:hypothetical protein
MRRHLLIERTMRAMLAVRKRLNTTQALIGWDALVMASCYPVFPLVRVVDRTFPYWVGGHVAGFAGYTARLIATDDDLMYYQCKMCLLLNNFLCIHSSSRHGADRKRQLTLQSTKSK